MTREELLNSILKLMKNMAEGKAKYNWEELKQKFFNSTYLEAGVFIRSELGMTEDEFKSNGNVRKKITGWTNAKKEWTKNRNIEIQKQLDKDLIEKLKIPLQESLGIRSMLSQLDARILSIFLRIIDEKDPPSKEELKLLKAFPDRLSDIWKRVQIELGLPTNVSELQGSEEKPLYFKNLVLKANEILGKDALR